MRVSQRTGSGPWEADLGGEPGLDVTFMCRSARPTYLQLKFGKRHPVPRTLSEPSRLFDARKRAAPRGRRAFRSPRLWLCL